MVDISVTSDASKEIINVGNEILRNSNLMSDITTVILAAGNSTRFKASKSKLVYPLCGLLIVSHIFNIAKNIW